MKLDSYILNHISPQSKALLELERQTNLRFINNRMISGHLQGKFLEMISKMIQPKRILEIGTFTGYSAICLAQGLIENGKLSTIEINDETEDFIRHYIEKAGMTNKIELLIGNALEIIEKFESNEFDIIFIDADKYNYCKYYQLAIDKIKSGGYIIADNVLWDGKVAEPLKEKDLQTKEILEFNEMVAKDPRVEVVIIPIRDGISIIRKK